MTEAPANPARPGRTLLFFCGAPLAIALALGGIAGGVAYFGDSSKADAQSACERLALLRGDGSVAHDVDVRHVSADLYRVSMTVKTPGLPDESFAGAASKDSDGDYVCRIVD